MEYLALREKAFLLWVDAARKGGDTDFLNAERQWSKADDAYLKLVKSL